MTITLNTGQTTPSFLSDASYSTFAVVSNDCVKPPHRSLTCFLLLVGIPSFYSNDVDVIVFSLFEHGYKQCSDEALGTYITPVPNFVEGFLNYKLQIMEDQGNDDYVAPDVAQYTECTRVVIQNQQYWLRLGCTDGTTQKLAVNIYSDNTCSTRSKVDGYDDSNIDTSDLVVSFRITSYLLIAL